MVCTLVFTHFDSPVTWTFNKNKLCKTLDCWSRNLLNFDFLERSLGIVPTKVFLMFYSINWSNFIVWLSLRHGVKVGPGPRDPGPRDPGTQDPEPPRVVGILNHILCSELIHHFHEILNVILGAPNLVADGEIHATCLASNFSDNSWN